MKKLKIVFLDSATMGDVTFAPISRHGDLILYDSSTPEQAKERIMHQQKNNGGQAK